MVSTLPVSQTKNFKPSLILKVRAEQERRKRAKSQAPITFREFIAKVAPKFKFYVHIDKLIAVLQRVADDEIRRLMVFMPPRHGKSETVSRLFSAYYLYRHPERWVGVNSYGADLAYSLSRNARENFREAGGVMNPQASGVTQWETAAGGGLWAAGVGGPITGKGFHLGLIDDPLKNAEEAASEQIRNKQRDWYRSTFYTREEAGNSAIVIIQTRWHEDDLSGWLLSRESDKDDDEPQNWHIVSMPAIAEEPGEWPSTCTVEPDEREPGEALCPERFSAMRLRRIQRSIGNRFWAALYQQRPQPLEGGLFKRVWFRQASHVPSAAWRVRYWDKAVSTSNSAKYTAGVRLAITEQGEVIVEHVVRGQWSTLERRNVMLQTAQQDASQFGSVLIYIEQEPGSSGVDSVQDEIRLLSGFPVFADRPSGDKDTRMLPLAAQAEGGNLYILPGTWNDEFVDELCAIPNGRYRDQADAAAGAFNRLIEVINARPNRTLVHDEAVSISPY